MLLSVAMNEKSGEENRYCFTTDISRQPQDVAQAADALAHVSTEHLDEELHSFYAEHAREIDYEVTRVVNPAELDRGVEAVVAVDAVPDFLEDEGRWLADVDGGSPLPQAEAVKKDNAVPNTLGTIATNGFGIW
jgi:hypothetical protein